MKRKVVSLNWVRQHSTIFNMTHDYSLGICALVDVEQMGFIRGTDTDRWYTFTVDGIPCIYFKNKIFN